MQINDTFISESGSDLKHHSDAIHARHFASNHFDDNLDRLCEIINKLMQSKGVFHITIHFASSQIACWTFDNPYSYQIYNAEEVFADNFMKLFSTLDSKLHTCIDKNQVMPILKSLTKLRKEKEGSELKNASIHMMNGHIGLTFACDDTRYINFKDFQPNIISS